MAPKVLTRAEEEKQRLERRLENQARAGARKAEEAVFAQNKVVVAREQLAKTKKALQEAQALASCRQTEVTTAQAELGKAVLLVTRLESSNTRQEKVVQEAELTSMAANVEERRAEEDRARTFKLVKAACELQRGARMESVGSEASSCSQDLGQDEELKKSMREDKKMILKLRELVENTAYVAKRFAGKFTAGQLRDLGRERVELELQVLNCRWKMGKFGGRVVSLQRLETDPYLGKKERVRLDVFRGKLVLTQ
jgi:hypothetical protein